MTYHPPLLCSQHKLLLSEFSLEYPKSNWVVNPEIKLYKGGNPMKFVSQSLLLLVTLALLAPTLAQADERCPKEIVKYVKANASPYGDGTKKNPFTTLAAAALATWDVLIVLPSITALDGGITLKPGQQIIGSCDPTDFTGSTTQSIITNSSLATNNGVGVTANGDNVIKNIYFKDTFSSAINYDSSTNLIVQDCLITGHNKGNVKIPSGGPFVGLLVGGIQGQCSQSGEALIEHVIIRNNNAGPGIQDFPVNPAHRELIVCKCEFAQLNANGIASDPVGGTTTAFSSVVVRDSYFHDFVGVAGFGFVCAPQNGSVQTVLIKNSSFYNIASYNIAGNPIYDITKPGPSPELKMDIDSCSFEIGTAAAIGIFNNNSTKSKVTVTNSISNNVATFFLSLIDDNAIQRNKLCGNTVTDGTFYLAEAFHLNTSAAKPVEITEIIGNCFTGSIGIELNASLINSIPWTFLDITAEGNCFFGSGSNSILFETITSTPTPGAFNGLINAHDNTFSGFTTDIKDNGSNVSYLVGKNFWGTPTKACTSTSMCGQYQICQNGMCFGPTVSLPTTPPLFIGYIDASHPLTESIACPCNCRFPASGTP